MVSEGYCRMILFQKHVRAYNTYYVRYYRSRDRTRSMRPFMRTTSLQPFCTVMDLLLYLELEKQEELIRQEEAIHKHQSAYTTTTTAVTTTTPPQELSKQTRKNESRSPLDTPAYRSSQPTTIPVRSGRSKYEPTPQPWLQQQQSEQSAAAPAKRQSDTQRPEK